MGRIYTKPLKGHKLTLTWSGEYGIESSSTASCICGWQESHSNQEGCRMEYRLHLERERERLARHEADAAFANAIKAMRQYIDAEITVMKSAKFDQFHGWHNLNHFIVETGQEFAPTPLPDDIAYREVKQCYRNATMLMLEDPERFVYCEGLGLTSWFPMHHAWVWDRSRNCVADPTWRFDTGHPPVAYIGIPFTEEYVRTALQASEFYGLIDNWTNDWPLLKLDPSEYRAAL